MIKLGLAHAPQLRTDGQRLLLLEARPTSSIHQKSRHSLRTGFGLVNDLRFVLGTGRPTRTAPRRDNLFLMELDELLGGIPTVDGLSAIWIRTWLNLCLNM